MKKIVKLSNFQHFFGVGSENRGVRIRSDLLFIYFALIRINDIYLYSIEVARWLLLKIKDEDLRLL